jgi:glucose-1-phosphate thymidylyltransferase
VGIVVGDTAPAIQEAVGDGSRFGLAVTYLRQEAPLGLAHAVLIARDFLGDEPFVMYLGDNLLVGGITGFVEEFVRERPAAQVLLTKVEHPENFGVAELGPDGRLVRLVEKPKEPRSNLALIGVYLFDATVHEAVAAITPSWRGELEITDAIQWLIDSGKAVASRTVTGWWKDTGQLDDMLEANRLVLEDIERRVDGELIDSKVEGRVIVQEGARLERAVVRGPAIIGSGSRITDAYIGPYTSIDVDVTVEHAEVEHSILLSGCSVKDLDSRMEASLLGKNVTLCRGATLPKTLRMIVGDNAEIKIP